MFLTDVFPEMWNIRKTVITGVYVIHVDGITVTHSVLNHSLFNVIGSLLDNATIFLNNCFVKMKEEMLSFHKN